jgi:hypothetical protein
MIDQRTSIYLQLRNRRRGHFTSAEPIPPLTGLALKTCMYGKSVSTNSVADKYKGNNGRPTTGYSFASAVLTIDPF